MKSIKHIPAVLLICLGLFITNAPAQDFSSIRQFGRQAFAAADSSESAALMPSCIKLLEVLPNNPVLNYLAARLNALQGNNQTSISYLELSAVLGYGLDMLGYARDLSNDPALNNLREYSGFLKVVSLVDSVEKSIENGDVAWTITDRDLLPEGIAFDARTQSFFLGSETRNKIIQINKNGQVENFTEFSLDMQCTVLGIEVDEQRRHLWACVVFNDGQPYKAKTTENGWTGILKLDVDSGKLIKKYIIPQVKMRHEFNDLVVSRAGDVYISNAQQGSIYIISSYNDRLRLWLNSDDFVSPNGITLSPDGTAVYMADWVLGIFKIDIGSKNAILLPTAPGIATCGIDGLYSWKNSLIAVQNGLDRIMRFDLNNDGNEIINMTILDANTPVMDIPTTGVVIHNSIFYIANRSMRNYHKRQSLKDSEMRDVTIVRTSITGKQGLGND